MAVIDTTLDFFKIPGIDTFAHLFGTKKPSGKGLSTEEVAQNIAAGFIRQRPYVVTETSSTQRIDANSLFLITANEPTAPIILTFGEAAFIGCEISVINKSDVEHSLNATYSGSTLGTVTLPAKSKMSLIWTGDGWIILDSQKINNNEFASALSPKDLPAIEAMNFGENSGYIKWTNGLLIQCGDGRTQTWILFPLRYALWRKVFCLTVNNVNPYGLTQTCPNTELTRFYINSCRFDGSYESASMSWFSVGF